MTDRFKRRLHKKYLLSQSCDDLHSLKYIRNYTLKVAIIDACRMDNIPIRAGILIWQKWLITITKVWNYICDKVPYLIQRLEILYHYIQRNSNYNFKNESYNFISQLYFNGSCNCLCGTALMFVLGDYLGYKSRISTLLTSDHIRLIVIDENDKMYIFETTERRNHFKQVTVDNLVMDTITDFVAYTSRSKVFAMYYATKSYMIDVIVKLYPFLDIMWKAVKVLDITEFTEKIEKYIGLYSSNNDMLCILIYFLQMVYNSFIKRKQYDLTDIHVYAKRLTIVIIRQTCNYYENIISKIVYHHMFGIPLQTKTPWVAHDEITSVVHGGNTYVYMSENAWDNYNDITGRRRRNKKYMKKRILIYKI